MVATEGPSSAPSYFNFPNLSSTCLSILSFVYLPFLLVETMDKTNLFEVKTLLLSPEATVFGLDK